MNKYKTQLLWQKKLMALLHDVPGKCFDILNHEDNARRFQTTAGFEDTHTFVPMAQEVKPADFFASAAERFTFVKGTHAHNFVNDPLFIHPLSSKRFNFPADFPTKIDSHTDKIQTAVGGIKTEDWHEKFFLYWRRWQDNATAFTPELSFLPADTRIPDHTIWTHMSLVSALAPCIEGGKVQPELLLFQLGSVQEFIAQARSTRDLWSGSYLISWLIAHAIKAITDEIGPDAVIFPSLRGNGIFDALHHQTFYATKWESGAGSEPQTTWERLQQEKGGEGKVADWLLTPTLPNRFLVIVPRGRGKELAEKADAALRDELTKIADHVWLWLQNVGLKEEWRKRWEYQIAAFPQTSWAVQPWLKREECLAELEKLPVDPSDGTSLYERLKAQIKLAEDLPNKDDRFFTTSGKLNNSGIFWSAHYALLDANLAARRNTRDFSQWDPVNREATLKDSLSGKEECIGDEAFWAKLTAQHSALFKAASHRYGAMNLIKRLWCRTDVTTYLPEKLGLDLEVFNRSLRSDSTQEVARRNTPNHKNPYIAIMALDGDQMGKWVSGAKAPLLLEQLAPKAKEALPQAAKLRRLLTPSYHLQFSEALANFAMHKARIIVEEHAGDLIYAGGDDVLAILPSTQAIACAKALRQAFRTDFDEQGRLYPGSRTDLSCGIAVGHQNAPLQMLVREAHSAEKRAKTVYGRAAVAINVYKRSGEIIEWGCKWDSGALALMAQVTELSNAEKLSGRFPYALAALLKPYALDENTPGESLKSLIPVVEAEVAHVLKRQGETLVAAKRENLATDIGTYLEQCFTPTVDVQKPASGVPTIRPQDFINLFLVETFMNRFTREN